MHHADPEPQHGPHLPLARSEVGHVSTCPCGVVNLTLHYLSLRFEPAAFRELVRMLNGALARIEGHGTPVPASAAEPADTPPLH